MNEKYLQHDALVKELEFFNKLEFANIRPIDELGKPVLSETFSYVPHSLNERLSVRERVVQLQRIQEALKNVIGEEGQFGAAGYHAMYEKTMLPVVLGASGLLLLWMIVDYLKGN